MRKLIFLENDTGGRLLLTTDINDDLLDCPKAEILDTGHSRQITVDNRRLDSPNHHSTASIVGYPVSDNQQGISFSFVANSQHRTL